MGDRAYSVDDLNQLGLAVLLERMCGSRNSLASEKIVNEQQADRARHALDGYMPSSVHPVTARDSETLPP
jgi:hypothetical protein